MIELDSAGTGVRREVLIGKVAVGRGRPIIIAGPCAVEAGYVAQAAELAGAGVDAVRACVYKPRTHPDSFQGLGRDADLAPILPRVVGAATGIGQQGIRVLMPGEPGYEEQP